ncbi:MAG: hypothetical protein ACI38B_01115 [Bifidobacterium sp.]|uniref:hypothetical protein n=1 Tax=Bifidobacterium sp. TaxID=41200 RepID=UPI003F0484D7
MKEIPEFSFQDTIRDTCWGLAMSTAWLIFGWLRHDNMSNAIQWPAITMIVGFLDGLTGSRPLVITLWWALILAEMVGYRVYFWACVGLAALSAFYIGINIGSKCGFVLRRAIHRHKNTAENTDCHDTDSVLHSQSQPSQQHGASTAEDIPACPESITDDQPAPASQAAHAQTAEQCENQHQTEQQT